MQSIYHICECIHWKSCHDHVRWTLILAGFSTICVSGARTFFQNTANPFKVLDTKNTGYINGKELRNILTTLNETEAISNADFEKLLQVTGIENDDGDIDYERLYQNMKDLLLA